MTGVDRLDFASTAARCTAFVLGLSSVICGLERSTAAEPSPQVGFDAKPGQVTIAVDGQPVAAYIYQDESITRPFFAHVRAPNGVQATRSHPPIAGQDLTDHATFHPGVWMAFGDISGSDYWRIQAPVKHIEFTERPHGGAGRGGFAVRNSYRDQHNPDSEVCIEEFRCDFRIIPTGYLVIWDSTFSSDREFYFGDQEEMGLGVRVATPLRVERTSEEQGVPPGAGELIDSEGRRNEAEIWGHTADWCDYSGVIDGQRLGIAIFCHPKNFRPSWFHARDYGLLEANPFGRAAFGKGEPSKVVIKPGDKMRLRYGVLVHAGPEDRDFDVAGAFNTYLSLSSEEAGK